MTALAADRKIPNIYQPTAGDGNGAIIDLLLGATETVYRGAFLSLDAGDLYGAPLAGGEIYAGLSMDSIVSRATNGLDSVRAITMATFQHAITSIAQADIGKSVYAADDQTLALADTTSSHVGRIINVPATGTAVIKMRITGETSVQAASAV